MNELQSAIVFNPWQPEGYGTFRGNIKLLILGESFYGSLPNGVTDAEFTTWMINNRAIEHVGKKSRRFFTIIQRTIEEGDGKVKNHVRKAFWNSVAFYNYIQSIVGPKSRKPPSPEMWMQAKQPFSEVLALLKPDLILILGERLNKHVITVDSLPKYKTCVINHPSSRGFTYARWRPVINGAIQFCLNKPNTL